MTDSPFPLRAVSVAAGLLTCRLATSEPNRSLCGRCRATGFDSFERNRSSRRCPHCKGRKTVTVGHTKR